MIKTALLGFGTVGSGVAEVMAENHDSIAHNAADTIELKHILCRRDRPGSPFASLITHDFEDIVNDPEVQIVAECIGGVGEAYDYTKRLLLAGKSVVTANKELVATHGYELLTIAKEKNLNYLFEASVGGGIPIIRPITQCLAANELDEIYGILNGTTNYILTQMEQCGTGFEEALKEAQRLGYAEADPTSDIEGIDACRKICILADLCFGRHIDPAEVRATGISNVSSADVKYAEQMGCKIKLLGRALRTGPNTVTAYVAPHLVSRSSMLSNVHGVMNGIIVRGNALGEAMFYGPGAGKLPTASAVVADIIDAAKHIKARKYLGWDAGSPENFTDSDDIVSRWFVRTSSPLSEIGRAFGNIRFVVYDGAPTDEYAFATAPMYAHAIKVMTRNLNIRSIYRILD
jgi:homoserine dehydrogenase